MISVASGGAAERMTARISFKVLRAGSGTPARYSSIVLGARLGFAVKVPLAGFAFFIRAMLQELSPQLHQKAGLRRQGCCNIEDCRVAQPSSTATPGCVHLTRLAAAIVSTRRIRTCCSNDDHAQNNSTKAAGSQPRDARSAHDCQRAAFHAASVASAYYSHPALQSGLHVLQ